MADVRVVRKLPDDNRSLGFAPRHAQCAVTTRANPGDDDIPETETSKAGEARVRPVAKKKEGAKTQYENAYASKPKPSAERVIKQDE